MSRIERSVDRRFGYVILTGVFENESRLGAYRACRENGIVKLTAENVAVDVDAA